MKALFHCIILHIYLHVLLTYKITFADDLHVIDTKLGQVQGLKTANGYKYLGVPYAAPPIGNLR